ncbi:hypothetical protein [Chryseobacterium sp. c4a]|uniref:hypothetical protein n=1 Tax=Chryseobacterium sp. c4a TaxID=1573582 RepID=UPI00135C3D40|nr:hypothetical protein [Chryseobacterium sp. c4a]
MKKLSMLMLAICSTAVFGQKVSDYKYVSIPDRFTTFKGDYGLEDVLIKALKSKKYTVLPTSKDQWPWEAKDNNCNVLNANVVSVSSFFTNKLVLEFKDCNNKTVLESKGSSDIKDFEEGLTDALKIALKPVGISNPVQSSAPQAPSTSTNSEGSANYSNGKIEVQKIQIDANQFILAKSGSSVPFAIFKTTSKKDVFMVKLSDNTSTMTTGYFENGNIVIDIPQADGTYSKEVFTQK